MRPWASLSDRFWAKVEKTEGCWLWRGALSNLGYGHIYGEGRQTYVHRLSWQLLRGPVPDGLCVLHHCDNPTCVNPDHLFLGTMRDNTADMWAKGRQGGAPARNAVKEVCDCHGLLLRNRRCMKGYANRVSRSEAQRARWAALSPEQRLEIRAKQWATRKTNAAAWLPETAA